MSTPEHTWMARLRPQEIVSLENQILKATEPNVEERIVKTLITLRGNGKKETTVKCIGYALSRMKKETNLNNSENVRLYIANLTDPKTKKSVCDATRNKYVTAYDHYCKINGIQWTKPYYKIPENTPLIPTSKDVQSIIDNSSENYVTIFTIESEIGCSPEELYQVTQRDINRDSGEISIKGVKGHGSANYRLKQTTKELLMRYLTKHTEEHPFPHAHTQSQMWQKFRAKASQKLNRPDLLKIELRNLRNYSGERYYKSLPVRDPILVMRHLRHKKLETTMHYIRAIVLDYEEDQEWISLITRSTEEECKAVEKGYMLVRAIDPTTAIYRKRKG
jgi:hypothetical protein